MKRGIDFMKIALITFMLILTGAQALYAQNKDDVEAAIHMDKFLTDHNPGRNFDPFVIKTIKSTVNILR